MESIMFKSPLIMQIALGVLLFCLGLVELRSSLIASESKIKTLLKYCSAH
jgi:hypothetical protein